MRTRRTRTNRSGTAPERALAALLLASALALTGCSGGGDGDGSAMSDAGDKKAAAPEAARAEDQSGGAAEQQEKLPATHIIRTAEVTVRVKSTDKALTKIRTVAETAGGFVTNESVNGSGDDKDGVDATVVVRVPQAEFASVLTELKGAGKTTSRDVKAKDVTEQVVDVESRVKSQRASVIRVRELMDQATKLTDVVVLEGELSSRQAELEALLSRQASLKDRTTMSTITLHVEQPPQAEKLDTKTDDPGVLDALSGGWNVLVTIVTWLLLALAAAAPFLVIAAIAFLAWRMIRTRRT